jgi:LemA protein
MKLFNFALCAVLVGSSALVAGCDVNKHMEDVGFKQGENPVEKGTIKYDGLVDRDEACNRAWADYEANLTRRGQMIPQVVALVRAQAANESATLVAIQQAQANATRPEIKLDTAKGDMEDPDKVKAFQQAQGTLGTQLSRLMVQAPAQFPTLGANQAFHDLSVQIEGTENRLLRAREQYNKVVEAFNTDLRHVSGKIMNPITGHEFKPRVYFQADEADKAAPKLDFGTPAAAPAVTAAPSTK